MKFEKLYKKAIEIGIKNDLRGPEEMTKILEEEKEQFKDLKEEEKKYYDRDKLFNPFSDTRILNGDLNLEVQKVMVGIDIEVSEILLAHWLNKDAGEKIDLVLSHHPLGSALAQLYEVMKLQSKLLAKYGVTISVAEQLMEKRISEVERRLMPINHTREIDAARILGIPLMCCHTPADNCVTHFLQHKLEKEKPPKLKDLLKIIKGIPEYDKSARLQVPPKIVSGSENNSCGRIYVDMTGGTEGSKEIFEKVAAGGISTLVCMHLSEDHLANAKKANLNAVIAGHISSDVLGLNLLLDEIEKAETLNFVSVSGFERIRR
ncbi:MAG: NGG1p interacting factor NIF3 [Candidatus Aminicenantales bacterium]